ncbi:MAG: baseplate J/gp47 family protein [Limnohabitans sp.]|nr:baseplate J/gp47 family protein [Limnohabitans sp.]
MMDNKCNNSISNLATIASDQNQRYIDALQPNNLNLIDFEVSDWILFAYNFASYVKYYDTKNHLLASGDWTGFFSHFNLDGKSPTYENTFEILRIKEEINLIINQYKEDTSLTPHLTLFVTFLLLLENSKSRFNALTKRHLDFYYKDILKIEKLPATPDKVYLIFELAKNASQQQIVANTLFDGDKDLLGKSRTYKSSEELVVNKASIAQLKNVYNDVADKIVASQVANSYDGLGAKFPSESANQFWPFGHTDATYPELPQATLGFAIASPILKLSEGNRKIEIVFEFTDSIESLTVSQIINYITVYLTTDKGWFELPATSFIDQIEESITTAVSDNILKVAFQLDESIASITNYNTKVLGSEFDSSLPIAKFEINTSQEDGYAVYQSFAQNVLEKITINVDVQNIKNVVLENDNAIINAKKPFFPFTTIPIVDSNFYIQCEEAFSKKWTSLSVNFGWKNTPASFPTHYNAYKSTTETTISPSTYIGSILESNNTVKTSNRIVTNDSYFKYNLDLLVNNSWENYAANQTLFTKNATTNLFTTSFTIDNEDANFDSDSNSKINLKLKNNFLHSLYPKIYASALASQNPNVILPNEPYTPIAENVNLSYTASETYSFINEEANDSEEMYNDSQIKLFHIHPFGYSEEHIYLKNLQDFINDKNIYLAPVYCKGGELFIGIENAQNLDQIAILFQVFEGSENPLKESFTGNQKIVWSILANNEWKELSDSDILLNETDNLLKSGIFKFNIPDEATKTNTVLPANIFWLKAKMHKEYDVVCKLIGVHTQVVLASFEDNGNDLSHLKSGLPAETITKLKQRLSTVKSVTQPYNSFDGKSPESDADYYRRVSERLRHKNRAITKWDYEHIILQEFPELYKVNCLNHTSDCSFQAPGNVTLVLVPDTVNKNVFDIYQPSVSTATLNKVKDYVSKLNSLHVNTFVINPEYETVKVSLAVKFKTGFDINFYTQELRNDITKFLSPWAYDKSIKINFGFTVHISVLIDYIEKLGYVDYLENVKLIKNDGEPQKLVEPSNPKSILVSAKPNEHIISTTITSCEESSIIQQNEECQL